MLRAIIKGLESVEMMKNLRPTNPFFFMNLSAASTDLIDVNMFGPTSAKDRHIKTVMTTL